MDYFFAACEELRHPELKAKPFVVGTATIARKERGVVQTCNYEEGSSAYTARCLRRRRSGSSLILFTLSLDDDHYTEMSGKVMGLLKGYGFNMEVVSVDEAALELGDTTYEKAKALAEEIKGRIGKELGLPCTIGISIGKVYAKMVCDSAKPNGIGMVKEDELRAFLKDRPVGDLLGVGGKTAERLKSIGVSTIGELAKKDPNVLVEELGTFGKELYLLAKGIDNSKIIGSSSVLSVGRERTLEKESRSMDDINKMLMELSKEVMKELVKAGALVQGHISKGKVFRFHGAHKEQEAQQSHRFARYTLLNIIEVDAGACGRQICQEGRC